MLALERVSREHAAAIASISKTMTSLVQKMEHIKTRFGGYDGKIKEHENHIGDLERTIPERIDKTEAAQTDMINIINVLGDAINESFDALMGRVASLGSNTPGQIPRNQTSPNFGGVTQ